MYDIVLFLTAMFLLVYAIFGYIYCQKRIARKEEKEKLYQESFYDRYLEISGQRAQPNSPTREKNEDFFDVLKAGISQESVITNRLLTMDCEQGAYGDV